MPGSRRRTGPQARARAAVVLLLLLALGVVAERSRWFARLVGAAGVERAWIWSGDPPRKVEPRAFYATRDFELANVSGSARLEVLGDPEYVVYLNGKRVGSRRTTTADEIDVYQVSPLLRAGTNRIVLELRSSTGSGAATVRLDDGHGNTVLSADGDWLVYGSGWRGLLDGEPFIPTARAVQLATSPFGRWAAAKPGSPRPRFGQVATGRPLAAVAWRRAGETEWRSMAEEPSRKGRMGGRVEIDFGREVTGYLLLLFDRGASVRGLVRFGAELADASGWNPDAVVLTPASRGSWQDAEPRRFRYVELVGLDELTWVGLSEIADSAYARLVSPPPVALLSALVRPVRTPVVDEIWRRYESPAQGPAGTAPKLKRDVAARTPAPVPGRSGRRRPATSRVRRALVRPTP